MATELENIEERYKRREEKTFQQNPGSLFSHFVKQEREKVYLREISKHFKSIKPLKVLEIGAGGGSNISFFKQIGILPKNIYANELLSNRIKELELHHPDINIIEGDANAISVEIKFDIVFQSTVFTSILDEAFKVKLAKKMISLVQENGIILWYDFIYNNPSNKDVKKVTRKDVAALFHSCRNIQFYSATLAPPIGRRVGRLYRLINILFPFLRTHLIAVIKC